MRADGTSERVHWDGESNAIRIPYHGDVALRAAVVDPESRVLLDEKLTNNFATIPVRPHGWAPRTFERIFYWAELAIQAVIP